MKQKTVNINFEPFVVADNEYSQKYHDEFNNLNILEHLGEHERIISLLNELSNLFVEKTIYFNNISHGGYIPIKCSDNYNKVIIESVDENLLCLKKNIEYYNIKNILLDKIYIIPDITVILNNFVSNIPLTSKIILCNVEKLNQINSDMYKIYYLSNTNYVLCIIQSILDKFLEEFHYYIKGQYLDYDNLINLAMIIKNGGDSLEQILNENLDIIDRWTILDTGSTDNTIDIINKVLVGKKKGNLHQEPFINFRESRNRCLDLAGKSCKFIITLDDTYIIKGSIRNFLNTVRGDQIATSFSFYIQSDDVQYTSNRIIKSESNLRYIYRIHEVITPKNNMNVMVPIIHSYIFDFRSDYMQNRTMDRKKLDLELLYDTVKEYPDDSRAYYYLGQTYNLLEQHELAYKNFIERMNHKDEGFFQEKIDAIFEAARIGNFKINKPWKECEELYFKAYNLDTKRPDSLYFVGIHYYLEGKNGVDVLNNFKKAYDLFKLGFILGYPLDSQYSLKPTLSFYFLPKFLSELCYLFDDYIIGEQASNLYLEKNTNNTEKIYQDIYNQFDYNITRSWYNIYKILNILPYSILKTKVKQNPSIKPYFCFLFDGGFFKWSGKDINLKGMGGSETFIIEMSKYIQKNGYYQVIIFCNCVEQEVFDGVKYYPIMDFFNFIQQNYIDTCIVGRYTEYTPTCLQSENIKNVYISLHDLVLPTAMIIPRNEKLKKVFLLSNWHVNHFINTFPSLKDIAVPFNYGIDTQLFNYNENIKKIPYKFIYSSFPTRGLLPLLRMWPKILKKYPQATLHLHCDINNQWSNEIRQEEMKLIKNILSNKDKSIFYHGWTTKKVLAENWLSSDIWFYPCTFLETFCLTALEAALTKTFVITRNFGSLEESVGNRGVFLDSAELLDPYTSEWQEKVLPELFNVLENKELKNKLLEENYKWAKNMSWENRADDFLLNYIDDFQSKKQNLITTEPENIIIPPHIKNIDNKLNYGGMYNWTKDLPPNSNAYDSYVKILDYIKWKYTNKEINVLEIGTFAGTSIIKILEYLPNSKGTVIDKWENYEEHDSLISDVREQSKIAIVSNLQENKVEEIFYNNIKVSGIQNMNVFKGDSADILLNMISENIKFDYIYIDGSHLLMDCYTDLILSFNLLNKGGLIGIDDFIYNKDILLESPFMGVEYFLNKFEKKINILHKSYRVFIEKI